MFIFCSYTEYQKLLIKFTSKFNLQGVESASKNEYQDIPGGKDGRCVRVKTLPPSCAECLEILEP